MTHRPAPFAVTMMLALSVLTWACGGPPSPKGPTSASAPSAAHALTFHFQGDGEAGAGSAASDYLQQALVGAGYRLVDAEQEADATIDVSVSSTERKSIFKVEVDGELQRSYDVRVTLSAKAAGRLGDQHSASFSADEGEIDEDALRILVPQLNGSKQFARFCGEVGAQRQVAAASAKQAAAEEAKRKRKEGDERAWEQADAAACRDPRTPEACDGIRAYLEVAARKKQKGGHLNEARRLLDASGPRLETLAKDEAYWANDADAGGCRAKRTKDACVGVELYLEKYPTGIHATDARRLLEASRVPPAGSP